MLPLKTPKLPLFGIRTALLALCLAAYVPLVAKTAKPDKEITSSMTLSFTMLVPGEAVGNWIHSLWPGIPTDPPPLDAKVKIYPNPAEETFQIEFLLRDWGVFSVTLFDLSGKRIKRLYLEEYGPGQNGAALALPSGLKAGVYILRLSYLVRGKNFTLTKQLVVRH